VKAPDVLLAKRPADPADLQPEETLVGHTGVVIQMAEHLIAMLAPGLQELTRCEEQDIVNWHKAVLVGAWLHDWGKANNHFQDMLRDPNFRQGIRHDTLSLVLVKQLEDWLAPLWSNLPAWVKSAAVFAAGGHHLKFPDPWEDIRKGTEVTAFLAHPDFSCVLALGGTRFGLGEPANLLDHTFSLLSRGEIKEILRSMQRELDEDHDEQEKILIAATKSTVMAADLAGSALPPKVQDAVAWINDGLARVLTTEQLEQVVATKLGTFKAREFQLQVSGTQSPTTLVEAGCGSGKTAAAYLWAARHANGKRLFFCYPTTGTASEGFAGYLRDPDFDAVLVHSRALVDYRLLATMPAPTHEENELRQAGLEALETWPAPAVVCTAHTVLGLMENVRRGIYAWPSLARAVFVFDEVHAFSDRLFSYLLRFLQAFPGAPVLLMTATLPPSRRQALENCAARRGGLHILAGPEKRENAKRYQLLKSTEDRAWSEVDKCIARQGKVLWVCNTVRRAMETLEQASNRGLPVQPYHSRYRYRDRLQRQRTVIDGFAAGMPAMLAITTQVAEMSLDLSADLLVSDWAPVAAMIQRMGRLNRFEEEPDRLGLALFLKPENRFPYEEEEMLGVEEWLDQLADGTPKSQADLANAFVEVAGTMGDRVEPIAYCEWLDGLWTSLKDRRAIEEAGYTIDVIREEDLATGTPAELAIPMPVPAGSAWKDWRQEGRYVVAPVGSIDYDAFKGAQWRRKNDSA